MRHVVVALLWLSTGVWSLVAQPFRVATWQVEDWPRTFAPGTAGGPAAGLTNNPADERWFNRVGATLNAADADVILLYGVPDGEWAKKIASLLQPRKYSVALHTGFRVNGPKGPFVGAPFAIVTRKERLSAKSVEWGSTGRIDLPGGFAFASFRHGAGIVTLYVSVMPGSLTNVLHSADGSYFVRKRGYAAQYLAHHASWVATTYTNAMVATYLTGDIPFAPKAPVADESGKILEQAGFRVVAPGPGEDKTTHAITNTLHLDRVLDPIFTKAVDFAASRLIPQPAPEHPLVTCDLTLKNPATAAVRNPVAKPAAKPTATKVLPDVVPGSVVAEVAPVTPAAPPVLPIPRPETSPNPPQPEPMPSTSHPSETAPASAVSQAAKPSSRVVAMIGGALLLLILIVVPRSRWSRWSRWSRRPKPGPAPNPPGASIPTPARNQAMFVELRPQAAPQAKPATANEPAVVLATAPTATGNAHEELRQQAAAQTERHRSAEQLRLVLTPHLQRIIREKLVGWLNHQRTQLLKSHEAGTEQVLSLQSRLDRIRGQFQARLVAQQERISELDHALKAKETIIRDLLRRRPTEH